MKRDPYGLLPSTACAAGEKLLFMEDFQNGKTILAHFDNGSAEVPLGPAPDEPGNTVIIHDFTNPKADFSSYMAFTPPVPQSNSERLPGGSVSRSRKNQPGI
jgi:hypothetical protein